jgi:hypothetical protein
MKYTDTWNRCDVCGKFIAMNDFGKGAIRHMLTPDAEGFTETWETLCIKHAKEDKQSDH